LKLLFCRSVKLSVVRRALNVVFLFFFSPPPSGYLPSFSWMTRSFLSILAKTWSSSFSFSFRREISALQPMSLLF
jgi:hypothetical protein